MEIKLELPLDDYLSESSDHLFYSDSEHVVAPLKMTVKKVKHEHLRVPFQCVTSDLPTPLVDVILDELVESQLKSNPHLTGVNWSDIATIVGNGESVKTLSTRWKNNKAASCKKGAWSRDEDILLYKLAANLFESITKHGKRMDWVLLSYYMPNRTGKQCRERWVNHLDPSINTGPWTEQEDQTLLAIYAISPRKWASIARSLEGRTENMVKIRYNSIRTKKLRMAKKDIEDNTMLPKRKRNAFATTSNKRIASQTHLEDEKTTFPLNHTKRPFLDAANPELFSRDHKYPFPPHITDPPFKKSPQSILIDTKPPQQQDVKPVLPNPSIDQCFELLDWCDDGILSYPLDAELGPLLDFSGPCVF